MIDTGLLSVRIEQAYKTYEIFKNLSGTYWDQSLKKYINKSFKGRGLTALIGYLVGNGEEKTIHILIARINFRRLAERSGIEVGREQDLDLIEKNFNQIMDQIGIPKHFNDWSVLRLDYCYNIYTPDVGIYLRLLKKGSIPRGMTERYLSNRKRRGQQAGSLYLISAIKKQSADTYSRQKGTRNINFYDKKNELINKGVSNQDLLTSAENVLRLETQIFKRRLKSIKRTFGLGSMAPQEFLTDKIATYEIERALRAITRSEHPYLKKSTAVKLIQGKRIKEESKSFALALINTATKSRLWGLDQAKKEMGREDFSKALDILKRYGVNPVCIADKECSPSARNHIFGLKDNRLESIFTLLDQAVKQEKEGLSTPEDLDQEEPEIDLDQLLEELDQLFDLENIEKGE